MLARYTRSGDTGLAALAALVPVDAFVVHKIDATLRGPALPKELERAAHEALAAAVSSSSGGPR